MGLEKADGGQVERNEEAQPPPPIHAHEDEKRGARKANDKHDRAKPEAALSLTRANVGDANIILISIRKRTGISLEAKE